MPSTTIGDFEMTYETRGEGPPLLAIMGLTGSFVNVAGRLAGHR